MAVILALLGTILLSALGGALVMSTTTETRIADNFRLAQEGLFAADAAFERALADLELQSDWNVVIAGAASSGFVDGPPSGVRALTDGSTIDLGQELSNANCRKPTGCSAADLTAVTAARPWGLDNPIWRPYAYGPVTSLLEPGAIDSPFYLFVMVADDPAHDPAVLWVRAEALGPHGARRAVESTLSRSNPARLRVLSWRALR